MTRPRCIVPPDGRAAQAAAAHRRVLPRLHTARLDLRAPDMADFPAWAAIMADFPDGPMDTERAWDQFCGYVAGWLLHGHGLWSVVRRRDDVLVGFVLLGLEWGDEAPELGRMLLPRHRGQGYATEAAAAARDHAARLLGGGVVNCVDPANAASVRVARRLGARRDPARADIWRHGAAE